MAKPEFLFVKRAMDIVLSLVALIILSPIFLITAIAVKSDGGPAFYKQVRLTKDAAHRTRVEVIENRVSIGQVALDRERPAGHNDHNDRFAGAFYGFEQVRLFAYQVDVAQRVSLSRQDSLFADKDNSHIGLAGDAFCSFEITGALVSRMTQPGLVVVFYVFVFVALPLLISQ